MKCLAQEHNAVSPAKARAWTALLDPETSAITMRPPHLSYRRIFVYNICLITISDTVSDGATKRLILNIERAQHD